MRVVDRRERITKGELFYDGFGFYGFLKSYCRRLGRK